MTWDNIRLEPDTTYEIKSGVTVTLVGKIVVRGNITITGGTIRTTPEAQGHFDTGYEFTFTLNGVTIDGEGKEYSRSIIDNGVPKTIINLNNCIIKDYKIKKNCADGIIELFGSALNITNSTITGCTGGVGMIRTDAGADSVNKIKITSSNITDNKKVVFSGGSMDITIDGGTFENNDGGLIYAWRQYNTGSVVTINGGTFKNNSAKNGGVISSSGSTVTINGGNFENNSATDKGGVIYNSTAESRVYLYGGYFADNTANGSPNDIYNGADAAIDLNIGSANVPSRTGYTYGGWKDNNGNIYNKTNRLYSVSGADNGLTVIWKANSYTINYSGMEGATLSPMPTAHVYGTNTAIADPVKTGYTFNGWKVNGGAAVKNLTLGATDYTNVISLQATWTANKYTVTFDKQNGTGGSTSAAATFNSAMPAITVPTRPGYTFGGYYTAKNGGGTQYYTSSGSSARNWNIAANTTLYAKWTAKTYTVTFDKQNGTGGSTFAVATFNGAMPAITVPTRPGYTFGGYYTAKNGGGTQYYTSSGASARNWNITANTTLYAKWTANTYTIIYNSNKPRGASSEITGLTASSTHTYDVAGSLTANGYSLVGRTFKGWSTSANGSVLYGDEDTVKNLTSSANGTYNLYAVWQANKYTVTFGTAGGSNVSPVEATFDSGLPTVSLPMRAGYVFGGFYTAENGGGTQYYKADGTPEMDKYTVDGNLTLFAKWTPVSYTIAFYDGDTFIKKTENVVYGAEITLPSAEALGLTRKNYNFVGWNLYSDQTWAMYKADTVYTGGFAEENGKTVILRAAWEEKNVYPIYFDANGGMGAPATALAHEDETVLLGAGVPVRQNHTFVGWATDASAERAEYFPDGEFTMGNSPVTLYAVWKHNPSLTYNANGGLFNSAVAVTYPAAGAEVTVADLSPQLEGHEFTGWKIGTDGTVTYCAGEMFTMPDTDTVLYAVWQKRTYPVTATVADGYSVVGLNDSYKFGDVAIFTVTGGNVKVYADGELLTASETGKYSFIVDGATAVLVVAGDGLHFSVVYNANGGSGAPVDANIYQANTSATVSSDSPLRPGYTFLGWTKKQTSSAAEFVGGETVTLADKDLVLYAVWKANTYTVKYNSLGGFGSMAADTFTFDEESVLKKNAFTKEGHTFTGWALNANGNATYSDCETVLNLCSEAGGEITLYAVWKATVTKIELVWDETVRDSFAINYGDALSSTGRVTPVKDGYTFGGYYTEREGGGEQIFDGNLNAVYANNWDKNEEKITLYAYWVPNSETLTAQIQQLKNANAALTSGIDALKSENLSMSGSITALSASLETAQNTIDSLGDTYATDGELAAAVAALEKKIEEAKSELNAKINEVQTNLENAVSTLNTSIAAKADSTALSQAIEDLTNAYEAADAVINSSITALQSKDGELEESIAKLKTSSEKADSDLKAAVDKVQTNLDKAVSDLTKTIGDNKSDIESKLSAVKEAYEAADAVINSSITALHSKDGELEESIAKLKTSSEKADSDLKAAVDKVQTNLDKAVSDLTKTIGDNKSDIESKLAAVKEAYEAADAVINSSITALSASLETAQNTIDSLGDTYATDGELAAAVAALEKKIEEAKSELNAKINEVQTNLENAVSTLNTSIAAKADSTALSQAIEDLTNAYEAADAVINSSITALQSKDGELAAAVAALEKKIEEAKSELNAKINEVQTNLENAVSTLNTSIAAKADSTALSQAIEDLTNAYEAADAVINSSITALQSKDGELEESIAKLKTTSEKADSDLKAAVDKVQTNLDKAVSDLTKTIGDNKSDIEGKLASVKEAYEAADAVINGNLKMLNVNLASEVSRLEKTYKEADDALAEAIKKVQANLDAAKKQLENKDNELATEIKILQDTTKNLMIVLIVIGGVLLSLGVSVVVLFLKRKVKP